LLDEPTANLDLHHQVAMLELVRGLTREQGLTVVAAVHDLQLAALYCDRLALMSRGQIVSYGAPEAVVSAAPPLRALRPARDPVGPPDPRRASGGAGAKRQRAPSAARPISLRMTMLRQTRKGLTIVYTGDGKGKTTAAVGLTVRAAGNRMRVLFVQF